jgi:hypothetical protein
MAAMLTKLEALILVAEALEETEKLIELSPTPKTVSSIVRIHERLNTLLEGLRATWPE